MRSLSSTFSRTILLVAGMFIAGTTTSPTVWALPNAAATVVSLRTDCGTDPNCFGNSKDLNTWLNSTPHSAGNPLQVNIGPGTFGGLALTCSSVNTG